MPSKPISAQVFNVAASIFGVAAVAFFTFLMGSIVWPYTSGRLDIDFLLTKQHIIHLLHYRVSFFLHIFPALLVLAAGVTQFSGKILKKTPAVHRWMGRLYAFSILGVCGPAGLVMAFYANGGWLTKASFITLSLLWWWATWKAYRAIRTGKIKEHGAWMIRSYALTLSAISLRIMQFGLASYSNISSELAYEIVAWPSWIVNLLLAELILNRTSWFGWIYGKT
jgi:uncharacterized membrane protein